MPDNLSIKIRNRVERRLSKSPRLPTIHALLFTLFTVPVGLYSALTHPTGAIDGVVYSVIFFSSIILFAHVGYAFLNSGAWHVRREKIIQEEVLDAGDTFHLNEDEMIEMHWQLSDDEQLRSSPFSRLMFNALGNLMLWPGMLVIMMIFTTPYFHNLLILSLLGTLALGFTLPLRQMGQKARSNYDDLRAVYGYKRKHHNDQTSEDEEDRLAHLGDDGELVLETDTLKRKHGVSRANPPE